MEGIIIKGIGGLYYVKTKDKTITCKARGIFRYNKYSPMVGDRVIISINKDEGVIDEIKERTTELIRPSVANVTQAFVVFALRKPNINMNLLNKLLVLCELSKLKSVVCFNKIDLAPEIEDEAVNMIKSAGYEVIFMKAKEGYGLDTIREKIKDNISVFCGPSGVGKSTLLNNLIGKEIMETGEISEKIQRGKHTTRHSELLEFGGGFLVDTPGFSSIDTNFIEKEQLLYYIPEFSTYNGTCKFSNCMHHKEPGCKVKEAVAEGIIHKERYDFYIKTLEEIMSNRRY